MTCVACGGPLSEDGTCAACAVRTPAPGMACPACGGAIREGAILCRHCHTRFPEPARAGMSLVGAIAPARAPIAVPAIAPGDAASKSSAGMIWLVFGGFAVLMLLFTGVFFMITRSLKENLEASRLSECRTAMAQIAARIHASGAERLESLSGSDLLYRLAGRCQCSLGSFRGPTRPWEQLQPDSVIACDAAPGHREGMHVVLRNGSVEWAALGTPLYQRDLSETTESE